MNTTAIETMTKTDVIAALIAGGEQRTARSLRDVRVADLRAMLVIQQEQAAQDEQAEESSILDHRLYTVAEVADLVGLTKFAVRRWVRLGYLANEADKDSREFRVRGADLASFLQARAA